MDSRPNEMVMIFKIISIIIHDVLYAVAVLKLLFLCDIRIKVIHMQNRNDDSEIMT